MDKPKAQKIEPEEALKSLVNLHYAKAARWGTALLAMQGILYLAGVVALFIPALSTSYPPAALLLVVAGTWLSSQASKYKGAADLLKRHYEYWQGFGRQLPNGLLADMRMAASGSISPEQDGLLRQGLLFSSSKPLGPVRVLENVCESAWFTKHLAGWCGWWLCVLSILAIVLAIVLLLALATSLTGLSSRAAGAQCVSATLSALLSIGVLQSWLKFRDYSQKAGEVEDEAQRLLKSGTADAFEAQRTLSEYQLLRSGAPLLPTLAWKMQRNRLNQNWNDLKKPTD